MNIRVNVNGDSGSIYTIEMGDDSGIYMRCSCKAARNNLMCKHRERIVSKDFSKVITRSKLPEVEKFLTNSAFKAAICHYRESISNIEMEEKELKKQKTATKKRFGRILSEGNCLVSIIPSMMPGSVIA